FEEGTVEEVFRDPQNPYTEGLLKSVPRLGDTARRLAVIPGLVPNPTNWPVGCRFQERCPYGWAKTEREEPPLFALGPGRRNKCWGGEDRGWREVVLGETGAFSPDGAPTGSGASSPAAGMFDEPSPDVIRGDGGQF